MIQFGLALAVLGGCGIQDPAPVPPPEVSIPPPQDPQQDPQQDPAKPAADRPVNRLADEASPYLRLHRHNPVDWYPWGEEALARAKELDKPIFLSIGYSACHWCHVMARESFESEEIAAVMNELFVCIKVDREERPDIDEVYMAAVQAMTGQGGWPMSVWLTPDLVPFYGGTYFPPYDGMGRPGFKRVLEQLAKAFNEDREAIDNRAEKLQRDLAAWLAPDAQPGDPSLDMAAALATSAVERYDPEYGGFATPPQFAPKFPHASELSALLREAVRTDDGKTLAMVEHTLEGMARGGMYDQLGGGFHRYSVDRMWLVPHFEKMLYDNALLARTYCEAYVQTGKPLYARIARETLDYMIRDMQDPAGGFYSATDAQSEGAEGKYFVWQLEEFEAACGDDAEIARRHWGVTADGNWEHSNVLHVAQPVAALAAEMELDESEVVAALDRARAALLAVRAGRVPPPLDDKVLTAWNGMAIAAMAVGHQVLGDPRYLASAQRAARFVIGDLRDDDGRLRRMWRQGESKGGGYLEDYGFFVDGLLSLFESDFDPRWLAAAEDLLGDVVKYFRADDGNFFFTADDHEELFARSKSAVESSTPSGIAMVIQGFLRAGLMLGDRELEDFGVQALRANHKMLSEFPAACPSLIQAVQFHLGDPQEVVVAGSPDAPLTVELLAAARQRFPPHHVVMLVHDGNREALLELAPTVVEGKVPVDGKPAAYVCRRGVCEAPLQDPGGLAR